MLKPDVACTVQDSGLEFQGVEFKLQTLQIKADE